MAKLYRTVSLFSGAMGLDIGLENTGRFETIGAVESNKTFVESLRANKDAGNLTNETIQIFQEDLHSFEPEELMKQLGIVPGEIDLLTGGPPCQSFSTAGRRGTTQDARGTLIWRFLHFVKVMKPKYFLMENVRGLMSAALKHRPLAERPKKGGPPLEPDEEPGSVIQQFIQDLAQEYRMDCFEVNAVNYGAPQLRERALFVGNRLDMVVEFPLPTHFTPSELEKMENTSGKPHETLRNGLKGLIDRNQEIMDFSPRKKEFLALVPEGGNWRCLDEDKAREIMKNAYHAKGGRSGWLRRLSWDLPTPTILTMPNHTSTSLCHPTELRALSLAECARIQGFPDEWVFCGTIQEKYRQVGNAVPIILGEVVGVAIAESMDRNETVPQSGGKKFTGVQTGAKKLIEANKYSKKEFTETSRSARVLCLEYTFEMTAEIGWNYELHERFRKVYIKAHVRTRKWFHDGKAIVRNESNAKESGYSPAKTIVKESEI
ncbi:DNA cytosine methyltransferase [Euryarchaeota archaeon]|nr:DNA cytosine methyltransferase [Euryarchaeota archaeon]